MPASSTRERFSDAGFIVPCPYRSRSGLAVDPGVEPGRCTAGKGKVDGEPTDAGTAARLAQRPISAPVLANRPLAAGVPALLSSEQVRRVHGRERPMSKPQHLIDADLVLYKSVSSAEFEADMGDGVWFLSTNLTKARDHWLSQVDAIKRDLKSDDLVFVFSGDENFRKTQVDPTYKGNRAKVRKPLGFNNLKAWAFEEYGPKAIRQPILEADDYIGILATTPGAVDRVIVSEDKDFNTVPCRLYQKGEIRDIDEEAADLYWLTQTLTGDSADGYKGCPGIGAVKAAKMLAKGDTRARWETVRKAFLKAGLTEDDAVTQARLARIL